MADKFEGRVHQPPARAVTLALHEPVGVHRHRRAGRSAAARPDLAGRAGAGHGQRGGARCRRQRYPLVATDLYQVHRILPTCRPARSTSSPAASAELAAVLAKHDDVDGLWMVADAETCRKAEAESVGNLKRVWTSGGRAVDWTSADVGGDAFLRRAVEVKNVWVPYGD